MRGRTIIPRDLQNLIDGELDRGERVEWMDMPKATFFTPSSTAAFVFAIPWTGFSLFWMFAASGFKVPTFNEGFDFFPLFGVPFFLIGLLMLSAPFWSKRKALQTIYAITDKRAITIEGGRSTTIRSYTPDKLHDIYRREHRDGTGDVIIKHRSWRDSDGDSRSEELGFFRIQQPKEVERRLVDLASRSRGGVEQ